jgi:broad specificity phosphatase PhoE
MTTLLLVRHAATAANLCRPYTLQGSQPDSELAPLGLEQAHALAEALADLPVTSVVTSPLRRALGTAGVIAERFGVPVEREPALLEADVGVWAGLAWEEVERRWPDACRAFRDDPEHNGYLGGESLADVRGRVVPVAERLLAKHAQGCLVVVAHGAVNRVLLAHWLGLPLRYARRLPQDNAGYSVVECEGGTARVRTVNDVAHLAGRLSAA